MWMDFGGLVLNSEEAHEFGWLPRGRTVALGLARSFQK
jgi:hypothetical protein